MRGCTSRRGRVYPRVCGGTFHAGLNPGGSQGLSPRVRGNPGRPGSAVPASRSIPACAGEPRAYYIFRISVKVYPRVCGGTARYARIARQNRGLSPRVRGNLRRTNALLERVRSIPACAGEPSGGGGRGASGKVYPRVCGGTANAGSPIAGCRGLSPRVRGNRRIHTARLRRRGSIPACAGEPMVWKSKPGITRVYPRVCGGTLNTGRGGCTIAGLSPRVRGNPPAPQRGAGAGGSIPACAGEPRAQAVPAGASSGLSPRVRGNHRRHRAAVDRRRSIPACAGEPRWWCAGAATGTVYPRVCGGTSEVVATPAGC